MSFNLETLKQKRQKLKDNPWLGRAVIVVLIVLTIVVIRYTTEIIVALLVTISTLVVAYATCRLVRGSSYRQRAKEPALKRRIQTSARIRQFKFSPNEKLHVATRQHFVVVLPWWLALAALLALAGGIVGTSWQVALIAAATAAWPGYKIAWWWKYRFCITDKRVLVIEGVFTKHHKEMRIASITDREENVGIFSKILCWLRFIETDFGWLRLESPGQTQGVEFVRWLPYVEFIADLIELYTKPPEEESEETILQREIADSQRETNSLLRELIDAILRPRKDTHPSS